MIIYKSHKERYRCPECGSFLKWYLVSGKIGARSEVSCGNNAKSSRIDWNPAYETICFWEGLVVRNKKGSVTFYEKNGIILLSPFVSK